MSTKQKLEAAINKIDREGILSIIKFEEGFSELLNTFPEFEEKAWFDALSDGEKELAKRLSRKIFYQRINSYENSIDRWKRSLFTPNSEELDKLKNFQKKFDELVLPMYENFKIIYPSIAGKLDDEKQKSIESKKILDELLKNDKYRQKAELLVKISELNKKIKIDPNNQVYKQELAELEEQLENLKDIPQNKEENRNDFPTKLVVGIGIGIGAVVILLIALLFSQFNRRN